MGFMKYIQQLDQSDCGCACLAMIASYFKCQVSLKRIREVSGTDKNGTNLNGMIIAAKDLSFNARALKGEKKHITPDLPVPFIAHEAVADNGNEFFHYVVVRKITKKRVYIYDPDIYRNKCSLSIEDFCKEWTGYCLFLTPSSDFKITKDEKRNSLGRFLPILKPHMGLLSVVSIVSFLLILFGIVTSFYFQYVIDEVIYSNSLTTLTVLSVGVLILSLFRSFLTAIRSYMLNVFSTKIDFHLIFAYFSHVMKLPVSFFDTRRTGEILSRMRDAQKIRTTLTDAAITVIMDTLMVFVVGAILLIKNKMLFGIAVSMVPVSSIIIWITAKPFAKQYRKYTAENANVDSYLVETMNGGTTIKALNASEYAFAEYEKLQTKSVWTYFKLNVWQTIRNIFTDFFSESGTNLIFWVGSFLILKGKMSLGELFSFNALLTYFLGPLNRLVNLQPKVQEALVSADRIMEILELDEEFEENPEKSRISRYIRPEKIEGELQIKNVDFTYGTRRQILFDINVSINKGDWVAFVGESGSGKSTLVKLLLKFYKPQKGDIILDNNNLEDMDTFYLRSKIGYVPQDIFLFSGTIADNISLHKSNATIEDIIEASKKAGAHEFISKLPGRYNTILSERGSSLSGGERQRIALARALLGNPELLIFDEATSSLDNISERSIHETLKNLRKEKVTTILIAHRLTTVINCDKIFVMEHGRIVEEGTHEQLKVNKGLYQKLWESSK